MKRLFVGIVMLIFAESAFAQRTDRDRGGPVGLTWTSSKAFVESQGAKLKSVSLKDFGESFEATDLPRALSDMQSALLSFGHNDKLWRVALIGRDVPNDPSGWTVRSRYDELASVLSEKYGKGKQQHLLGDSIYKDAQYFLAGIEGGKTYWSTFFSTPEVDVQIGIRANRSSVGYYLLIFEDKAGRREFDAEKKVREKKAL